MTTAAAEPEVSGAPPGARDGELNQFGLPVLTDRQAEVLAFLRSYIEARGVSPTHREIMERCHLASPNGVAAHLKALARKGRITITSRKMRSILVHALLTAIPIKTIEEIRAEG